MTKKHSLTTLATVIALLALCGILPAQEVTLSPATGHNFRPGTWIQINAHIGGIFGDFRPVLRAFNSASGDIPAITCELPVQRLQGNDHLRFFIPTGSLPLDLRLELAPPSGGQWQTFAAPATLLPQQSGQPLKLWANFAQNFHSDSSFNRANFSDLPQMAYLYRGLDLLVLGKQHERAYQNMLLPAQCRAILEWVSEGGIVIVLDPQIHEQLTAEVNLPAGIRPAPLQDFLLPGANPPFPLQRLCGLGRIILLTPDRGNLATIGARLQRELNRQRLLSRSASGNFRLRPARYNILGNWPPPPGLSPAGSFSYIVVWLLVCAGCLFALPRRWITPGIIGARAVGLLARPAQVTGNTHTAFLADALPTGNDAPVLRGEEILACTPLTGFRAGAETISGEPFTPLAATARELNNSPVFVWQNADFMNVSVGGARAVPVLFSRRSAIPAPRELELTLRNGAMIKAGKRIWLASGTAHISGKFASLGQIVPLAEGTNTEHQPLFELFLRESTPPTGYSLLAGQKKSADNLYLRIYTSNP